MTRLRALWQTPAHGGRSRQATWRWTLPSAASNPATVQYLPRALQELAQRDGVRLGRIRTGFVSCSLGIRHARVEVPYWTRVEE